MRGFGEVIRQRLPDILTDEVERYLSGGVAIPPRSPLRPVLSHADLKGEHIIVSDRGDRVAGIIDWTACRRWSTTQGRSDEGLLPRVCFYARCFSLDNLGWWLANRLDAPVELLKAQARWAFSTE